MKLKYPRKKKLNLSEIPSAWSWAGISALVALSFFGGMLYYRDGYASRLSLALRGLPQSEVVVQSVDEVAEGLESEAKLYQTNGLANIFLDVPFESMMQLESKREEALALGVLYSSDEDFVPATLRYNDEQTLDVKLRLKGDWVDHLRADKWSFRVHVTENDGAVLGMRRFSLQAPHTRSYVSEWAFVQNLLLEDILTTRYHFVNVILNGDYKGIYALEESFHADLLESQGRREGVIFRFDEDLLWYDWTQILNNDYSIGSFWLVDEPLNNAIEPFRGNHIAADPVLAKEFAAAQKLLYSYYRGEIPADQVLDEALWGRYFALTDLWGGGHGTEWINTRFYYNPITGLIEPVAYDSLVFHPSYDRDFLAFPFVDTPLFNSPGVQKAYVETLERITRPEYIAMLKERFGEAVGRYYKLLVEEYRDPALHGSEVAGPPLILPWDDLAFRADKLNKNLNPAQPVRGNYRFTQIEGRSYLQLDLVNLMPLPVEIEGVVIGGISLPFDRDWCFLERCLDDAVELDADHILFEGNTRAGEYVPYLIPAEQVDLDPASEEPIALQVRIYGGSRRFDVPIYSGAVPQEVHVGVKPTVTLEEALAAHEFLIPVGEDALTISPGDWDVNGDLVIPPGYDLLIPAGTTLRFESGSLFLAYGRIRIAGTEVAPVLLTAQADTWGGMVVLNATTESSWRYVTVEKMAGITSRPGWALTGGITFYESDVDIAHARIGDNTTEDALNVVRASLSLDYVEFQHTASDAFDGDFVSGSIAHSSFIDIGGDAVDLSGSQVTVSDTYIVGVGDKGVSAGEGSQVHLRNLTIREVGFGVVSKDRSNVLVETASIDAARVAGLAAYIKKPQYGPATLEASDVKIENTQTPALCQLDSLLVWNGETIPSEDIDVDALYQQGDAP